MPVYAASAHARLRKPTWLVVIALDPAVADWARTVCSTLQGGAFAPLLITRDDIPRVTDPDEARRRPELAVLSALAHCPSAEPDALDIGRAALGALDVVGATSEDRGKLFADAILAALGELAPVILEAWMGAQSSETPTLDRLLDGLAEKRVAQQVAERLAEAEAHAEARAEARGEARGFRAGVRHLCAALGIELDETRREQLEALDAAGLEALCVHLERERRWPT